MTMDGLLEDIVRFCLPPLVLLAMFWGATYERNRWHAGFLKDFAAALAKLGIHRHVLIIDKRLNPLTHRTGEIYRIFHDGQGSYYLYTKIGNADGVLKALTRERALLAIETCGYPLVSPADGAP